MATQQLLSLAGWWFLPNLATSYAQPTLYRIFIRAGDPHPALGSPRYNRDRKRIHISVIVLYLLYTIYEAEHQIQLAGNFYRMLGVPINASQQGIRSRWRRIAATLHPDKAAPNQDPQMFTTLSAIHEVLSDPVKKFAYDRFGADVLTWQSCKIKRDFIISGLYQILAYYIGTAGILFIIYLVGYLKTGVFWRYYFIAALFVLELASATRPDFLPVLSWVNGFLRWTGLRPEYLPFQLIILLRKVAITFFVAMNQLGPLFERPEDEAKNSGEKGLVQQLNRVEAITNAVGGEVEKLLRLECVPFSQQQQGQQQGGEADMQDFKKGIREFLEGNTVRNEREVQVAIMEVVRRRREAQGLAPPQQGGAGGS